MAASDALLGEVVDEKVLILGKDANWYADALASQCSGYNFTVALTPEAISPQNCDADILIGFAPYLPDKLIAAMPRLKWIHALTTGVDNLLQSDAVSQDIVISNSNGFHGPQMAELAFLLMLSATRNYTHMADNQKARKWERWSQPLLMGKTACIVGLGAIAEELVVRCNAFGMHVTGVSDGRASMVGVAQIYNRSELTQAATDADFLIVLVPYSSSTHHIIDDAVLIALGPQSVLINIARGGCVDEAAVKNHLEAGTIKAAGMDVFQTEPLPADNPLWSTPGALITPHIGGMSDVYNEQVLPVIIENLKAWKAGGAQALPGLIQPSRSKDVSE